jgi:Mn2+/Fe2+ NRAMP family transporter
MPVPEAPQRLREIARVVGPGIVVAATGVGAGDLVSAAKAGAAYGLPILWAAVAGAVLKYVLAEGVARWQLATGTPLLEGWVRGFGWPVRAYFLVYLVLWTFIVSAALMSACGLAAHALFPWLSVGAWAAAHAGLGCLFVWLEGYGIFERTMKWAIGLMFVAIVGTALIHGASPAEAGRGLLVPTVPHGSVLLLLGVIGGVGGTLTLLSSSYWMQEKGWSGPAWSRGVRFDLGVGYLLTAVFGVCLILLAGTVLLPQGIRIEGNRGVLEMAGILGRRFGRAGELVFLVGFWAAVASSLLGVWQGVPYLFAHYVGLLRRPTAPAPAGSSMPEEGPVTPETPAGPPSPEPRMPRAEPVTPDVPAPPVSTRGRLYRGYLLFMTFPPMVLLALQKPVWLIVVYAAVGALFMPFLAGTLLVLNNRRDRLGSLRNGVVANLGLLLCLALFAYLAIREITSAVFGSS